ncbi:MAG: hypothetical protein D6753_15885 [Planctomycetota bacterium]|nr:MAG: hypothetical protein D6753_15885 [Planctomycetota bacterium]
MLGSGCQGLGIPSHRQGEAGLHSGHLLAASPSGDLAFPAGGASAFVDEPPGCEDDGGVCGMGEERIALVPPLPRPESLCRVLGIKKLPDPPPYPRFHPVPTRPVFSPAPMPPQFAAAASPSAADMQQPLTVEQPPSDPDRKLPSAAGYQPYPRLASEAQGVHGE